MVSFYKNLAGVVIDGLIVWTFHLKLRDDVKRDSPTRPRWGVTPKDSRLCKSFLRRRSVQTTPLYIRVALRLFLLR